MTGRAVLVLSNPDVRKRAADWIADAPTGSRIEFKEPKRSNDQNSLLWAMLGDVARQATHAGRKYDTAQWKSLFLHAFGREMTFIPALDGKTFLPIGLSSSDLSKKEMSDLLAFIESWAAEHDIILHVKDTKQG